jgi:hypothetical protein
MSSIGYLWAGICGKTAIVLKLIEHISVILLIHFNLSGR